MDKLILMTTTNDDRSELEEIAAHLVNQKLAACCQISGPISSWYSWKGETVSNNEWTLSIKSLESHYLKIEQVILEIHHYDTPQVISIDLAQASEGFEKWVRDSTES